ncbi:hypothetical protein EVAR_57412_1 [Eumeta japonica]|uniref:Uncharacterized protein n=1 Tax=Eumeta variegata TaxID=151549 RepID=A0A4C2A219_EUMVA|nr:hypothetical protein EVAR_57412_1 [Eumeta japonica]
MYEVKTWRKDKYPGTYHSCVGYLEAAAAAQCLKPLLSVDRLVFNLNQFIQHVPCLGVHVEPPFAGIDIAKETTILKVLDHH